MNILKSALYSFFAAATLTIGSAASPALAQVGPNGFVELTKRLSPAVVNISTAQTIELEDEPDAFPEGSPLERFNDFFGRGGPRGGSVAKSLGSGFVIDPSGLIVTNNHVIEDADVIEVIFPNGEIYQAELLGRDPATDIALMKIEGKDAFPFVNFSGPDSGEVGEWVIAIGNPFGYGGSVAAGIISARNRNIDHGAYDDFIQSDVAINKGNSGGPLFNMEGEVIGVNTAILSPTGGSVGISFAVPAELAQSVVTQLQKYGETRRGRLGASVQEVSAELAKSYGLSKAQGALITRVQKDSPAERAGLKVGDLITIAGGIELPDQRRLFRIIAEADIGKDLEMTYIRKRRKKTAMVTIERLKEKVTKADQDKADKDKAEADRVAMGISVEALTEAVRRKYKIKPEIKGVRVVDVNTRSDAGGKVQKGDIIEEVGFTPVETPEDFAKAVEAAEKQDIPVQLLVRRGSNYVIYAVKA